jgi:hypothetical protein
MRYRSGQELARTRNAGVHRQLDDIDFPRERAGFLHRNANAISLRSGGRKHDDGNRCETQRGTHREMMPQSISVAKGLGARPAAPTRAGMSLVMAALRRRTLWSRSSTSSVSKPKGKVGVSLRIDAPRGTGPSAQYLQRRSLARDKWRIEHLPVSVQPERDTGTLTAPSRFIKPTAFPEWSGQRNEPAIRCRQHRPDRSE